MAKNQYSDALNASFKEEKNQVKNVEGNSVSSPSIDYYDALKNESYKTLLNSQIQASVAKDQALKYTQQALQNAGYGSQGIAESSRLGVQSQYANALQNASNQYQQSVTDIEKQKLDEEKATANSEFEALGSFLTNAESTDDMNDMLSKYGITVTDGKFDYSNANVNFDDATKRQLEMLYSLYDKQFAAQDTDYFYTYNTAIGSLTDSNGKTGTLNDELKFIFNKLATKIGMYDGERVDIGSKLKNGDVMMIKQSEKSGASNAYLIYKDGYWKQISEAEYFKSASNKWEVYSRDNASDIFNIRLNGKHITRFDNQIGLTENEFAY